jgi:hypothetical protein
MKFPSVILAIICLSKTLAQGQMLQQQKDETIEHFVNRIKPNTRELAHPVLETTVWGTGQKTIIVLYGYDDYRDANTGYNKIDGHLYIQESEGRYKDICFGPIEENGGYPEILSVFFANADKDAAKELIILCKYPQQHYDYGGAFYETFIFDNPAQKPNLVYLDKVSKQFYGCECGWRNGKTEVAKYKTAAAVKTSLKNMRF